MQVLRWPFAENDRAHTDRATRGLVKVLATKRGRIVGADILGHDAGELIAPFVLAVAARAERQGLRDRGLPLSDARGGGAPRGDRVLCAEARFALAAARDPPLAQVRVSARRRLESAARAPRRMHGRREAARRESG